MNIRAISQKSRIPKQSVSKVLLHVPLISTAVAWSPYTDANDFARNIFTISRASPQWGISGGFHERMKDLGLVLHVCLIQNHT